MKDVDKIKFPPPNKFALKYLAGKVKIASKGNIILVTFYKIALTKTFKNYMKIHGSLGASFIMIINQIDR